MALRLIYICSHRSDLEWHSSPPSAPQQDRGSVCQMFARVHHNHSRISGLPNFCQSRLDRHCDFGVRLDFLRICSDRLDSERHSGATQPTTSTTAGSAVSATVPPTSTAILGCASICPTSPHTAEIQGGAPVPPSPPPAPQQDQQFLHSPPAPRRHQHLLPPLASRCDAHWQ